ncbi:prealbumin-like fold domain-containing protein [Marinobacterium arenosum]|uniref:prealbumin-like fold domain-containing protein n=1 Tax=Marinobacterium arenosum TaxID=2862496 RepID=UPI001C94FADC|nr:hypothetical protein [Marinobacterium arenosum]MBY4678276.1 hypothetical protein [Marinobacterium arenosum]
MPRFSSIFKITSFLMGCIFATGLVVMFTAHAVHDLGIFELDNSTEGADAFVESSADWATTNCPGPEASCGLVSGPNVDPDNPGGGAFESLFIADPDSTGNMDDIFTGGGSKDDLDVSEWQWTFGSTPDKDDLLPIGAAAYLNGDLLIYMFGTLFAPNGDASIGAWLFKKNIGACPDGSFGVIDDEGNCLSNQPEELHTVGDVFVVSETTNGGREINMQVFQWVGSDAAACAAIGGTLEPPRDTLCKVLDETMAVCDSSLMDDDACGSMNRVPTESPDTWGFMSKFPPANGPASPAGTDGIQNDDFPATSFFEAGFNFTALFPGQVGCFNTFLMNTRTSQSVRAQLKDLALGGFPLCGIKVTKEGPELSKIGDEVTYTVTIENTGFIPAYRVSISDDIFGDLTGESGVDCEVLQPDTSCSFQFTRTVPSDASDPLVNLVTALYNSQADANGDDLSAADDHTLELFQPSFSLTKECPVGIGTGTDDRAWKVAETLDFRFTLTNTSSSDTPLMELVSLTDPLLSDAMDDSILHLLPAGTQQALMELSEGESISFTLPYSPTSDDFTGGGVTNVADAVYSPQDFPNQISANDGTPAMVTCPVALPGPATIIIEKELRGGDGVEFTFTGSGLLVPGLTPVIGGDTSTSPHGAVRDPAVDGFAMTEAISVPTTFGAPTQYSVEEIGLPAGTSFDSVSCRNPDGSLDADSSVSGALATINVDEDEIVVCRFINTIAPKLTLAKIVTNDNGGTAQVGDFDLHVSGGVYNGTEVFKNGDMPAVEAGVSYSVSETLVAGYSQTGLSCVDDNSLLPVSHPVTLDFGQAVTCTISNDDDEPSLTLIKQVINDNGGTALVTDWTLTASGPTGFSGTSGVSGGAGFNVGSYDLSESGPSGYSASDWSCVGGTQQDGDTISVGLGESATCTIVNDDNPPSLTLIKQVINNNGGTAVVTDWTLTASGPSGFSGTSGVSGGADFVAGSYDLSESGPSGYSASSWSCVGGTQQDGDTISVGLGESATCTIVNDDVPPSLTLIKQVINDNGGTALVTDWTLFANGPTGFSGTSGVSSDAGFSAGSYDLSESGPANYSASDWSCVGGSQQDGDTINLGLGESATCTIVNDDNPPSLTLIKEVINDNGGTAVVTDWTLTASGPSGFSGTSGVSGGADFVAGSYDLSESGPSGYSASDWSCVGGSQLDGDTISVGLGESATCTIVNDDNPPSLTLIKQVINDNGGTAVVTDWTLFANGPTGFSGTSGVSSDAGFSAGSYDLSESGPANYSASDWSCVGGSQQDGDTISLGLGESATCTIVNDDNPPSLTLIKQVINDDGGMALVTDWTLFANGPTGFSGTSGVSSDAGFNAGSYDLSESGPAGYSASDWSCVGGSQLDGDTISLGLGDSATCTIINDDIAPTLEVIKLLVPETDSGLFNLLIDGVAYATDVGHNGTTGMVEVTAGDMHVVSETAGTGTSLASYETLIGGDCAPDGTVTLALAEVRVCTITNTFLPGDEGCTPGYWKVPQHHDSWMETPYSPDQLLSSVFNMQGMTDLNGDGMEDTLLDALNYNGGTGVDGAARILMRAAVAALLNEASSVQFSVSGVIGLVNDALATMSREQMLMLAKKLDDANNTGECPLN